MKKIIKPFALLSILTLGLLSCKKESTEKPQEQTNLSISKLDDPYVLPVNTVPLDTIILGDNDTTTQRNRARLFVSVGLRQIVQNSTYAQWIYNQALASDNYEVDFADLFAQFPQTKTIVENAIDPIDGTTGKSFTQLESLLTYGGREHVFSIYIPNIHTSNINYTPIASPGICVPYNGQDVDQLLTWKMADGVYVGTNKVTEQLTANLQASIFSVEVELPTTYRPGAGTPTGKRGSQKWMELFGQMRRVYTDPGDHHYEIEKFKITESYEAWVEGPDCEIHMAGACFETIAGVTNTWQFLETSFGAGTYPDKQFDGSIGRTSVDGNMSNYKTVNKYFCQAKYDDDTKYQCYFNTYERDWYASHKNLGQVTYNGVQIKLSGKMQDDNNWFTFDPNNLANHRVKFDDVATVSNPLRYWNKGFWDLKLIVGTP